MTITSNNNDIGLFANLQGTVKNLKFENVSITTSAAYVGTVFGGNYSGNSARVINVGVSSGNISSSNDIVGGICGGRYGTHTVTNCYVRANVSFNRQGGGIIGRGNYSGEGTKTVNSCYFSGNLTAKTIDNQKSYLLGGWFGSQTVTSSYYDSNKTISWNYIQTQGTALSNFGSMKSLPEGLSSDTWEIVDGYPELKVFADRAREKAAQQVQQ